MGASNWESGDELGNTWAARNSFRCLCVQLRTALCSSVQLCLQDQLVVALLATCLSQGLIL